MARLLVMCPVCVKFYRMAISYFHHFKRRTIVKRCTHKCMHAWPKINSVRSFRVMWMFVRVRESLIFLVFFYFFFLFSNSFSLFRQRFKTFSARASRNTRSQWVDLIGFLNWLDSIASWFSNHMWLRCIWSLWSFSVLLLLSPIYITVYQRWCSS